MTTSHPFPAPDRQLPTPEAADLLALSRTLAERELAPRAAAAEEAGELPREVFRRLGQTGLLGLPYPEEYGGGGQPYTVYLQVVEELARAWASVAMGVSVHVLACHALATAGTPQQRERWLPGMVGGDLLGAYCLSEAHSGSDAAAMRTRADRDPGAADAGAGAGADARWRLHGAKAWITHGGHADFYTVFARDTPRDEAHPGAGITCFLVPGDAAGLSAGPAERKLGFSGSPTTPLHFDAVAVDDDRRLGEVGRGFDVAKRALDAGRLGIAAVAVGLAQGALEDAVSYAREREQFGRPVAQHQGLAFLLADMATAVAAARALYLDAARLLDARAGAGTASGPEPASAGDRPAAGGGADADQVARVRAACAMAKAFCTDAAMRVTTDAVQVLGGAGYVRDHRVERLFREAKALQIVEGTNQVQRMVVGGLLAGR